MSIIAEEFVYKKGKPKKMIVFLHGYEQSANLINKLIVPFLESLDDCVVLIPASPFVCEIDSRKCQWYSMQEIDPENRRKKSKDFNEVVKIYEKANVAIKPAFENISIYIKESLKKYKIKSKNLYLCGFSQGASLTLYTSLMLKTPIAGAVSISGILCPADVLLDHHQNVCDVLLIHGKEDKFIKFEALDFSKQKLEKMGCIVSTYAMDNTDHFITEDALLMASSFINAKK